MSKTRIFAIVGIIILLVAVFTNPKEEKVNKELAIKAKEILKKQLQYKQDDAVDLGMMLFGDRVIEEFIGSYISTNNYYLFTLSKINWNGESISVATGAFGKVWISPKLDEKADLLIEHLKKQ